MQDINLFMSRILVIGIGPTPSRGGTRHVYAPGLRLWNFATTLLKSKIDVIIAEALFGEDIDGITQKSAPLENATIPWYTISLNPAKAIKHITDIYQRERMDAIISSTEVMNNAVVLCDISIPCWLDFNGDPMTERQMQAAVYGSDMGLLAQWEIMAPALLHGDHFSSCSLPQKHALIGQLGACGRLNRFTSGHDLVTVLPPAPALLSFPGAQEKPVLRGIRFPEHAFIILWSGGYNTWSDVDTLFSGLTYAMERNERIHYVSTGGAIKGHDEKTYERFVRMIDASRFKDHFHLMGWVKFDELPAYYHEADAAVNIDTFSYEATLGCRNRLFDWIVAGLPVITTAISELTQILTDKNLVSVFKVGDAPNLGNRILDMAVNPEEYHRRAERARHFLTTEYTTATLLAPLVSWAQKPRKAPDLVAGESNPLLKAQQDCLNKGKLLESLEQQVDDLHAQLNTIKGSRLFKVLNAIKRFDR